MSAVERAEKMAELESIRERGVARATALARLAELLADEDEDVRAQAAEAGGAYPAEDAVTARLLELATDDGSTRVRSAALTSLGRVVREGDLAGAAAPGYAPDPELEEPSAERFAAARDLLLAALEREEGAVRLGALEALAYLSHEPRVVSAIEALAEGSEAEGRAVALRCMGLSGDPRWAERIEQALEDGEGPIAQAAAWAAGASEVTAAAPFLGRLAAGRRQPPALRLAAIEALGSLGKEATSTLLELAEDGDEDEALRRAARVALENLTLLGREPGEVES